MADFAPVIVNVNDYRRDNCVDIVFKIAGVQTQRRASGEAYLAIKTAGYSDEAIIAFLATEPANVG